MKEEHLHLKKEEIISPSDEFAEKEKQILAKKKVDIYGLSTLLVRLIITLLVANAALSSVIYLWKLKVGVKGPEWFLAVVFWFFDFYLAYALTKREVWVRSALVGRAVVGCGIILIMGLLQGSVADPIVQAVFFTVMIILCTGKVDEYQGRLLSGVAFLFLAFVGYRGIDGLFFRQRLLQQIMSSDIQTYVSQKNHFAVSIPNTWIRIERRDFDKLNKEFLKLDAEVALVTVDERGYCVVSPQDLDNFAFGYDVDYKLQALREYYVETFSKSETVQNLSAQEETAYGNGGFEIQWVIATPNGNLRHLMIYGIFDRPAHQLGIQVLAWAPEQAAEEVFRDVKKMMASIELR